MSGHDTRCFMSTLVALVLLVQGGECFQWSDSLEDFDFVAACVHGNLTLSWNFTLDSGETAHDIKWNFRSEDGEQELIATNISGMFLPSPPFSQRVQYVANAGLFLDHVTQGDAGNYSVEVSVRVGTETVHDFMKTASVEVAEGLSVREEPGAVYDPQTDSWHVVLACGTVVSPDGSPEDIIWQTPSGVLPSTRYDNGYFYLQLQNPVKGGDYNCSLAANSTASLCLPSSAQKEPQISVDETKARVTLLEAENGHLKVKVNSTHQRLTSTEAELVETRLELNQTHSRLTSTETVLTETLSRLSQLDTRLNSLEMMVTRQVSFYARMASGQQSYNNRDRVLLTRVLTNQGGAYSGTTSVFTAPLTGTYFFAATAGFYNLSHSAAINLMMDNTDLCYAHAVDADSSDVSSTCTVTVRLTLGQTVWLRSWGTSYFQAEMTTFTGFLVHAE